MLLSRYFLTKLRLSFHHRAVVFSSSCTSDIYLELLTIKRCTVGRWCAHLMDEGASLVVMPPFTSSSPFTNQTPVPHDEQYHPRRSARCSIPNFFGRGELDCALQKDHDCPSPFSSPIVCPHRLHRPVHIRLQQLIIDPFYTASTFCYDESAARLPLLPHSP